MGKLCFYLKLRDWSKSITPNVFLGNLTCLEILITGYQNTLETEPIRQLCYFGLVSLIFWRVPVRPSFLHFCNEWSNMKGLTLETLDAHEECHSQSMWRGSLSISLSPDLLWASCPDKTRLICGFLYTEKHAKYRVWWWNRDWISLSLVHTTWF